MSNIDNYDHIDGLVASYQGGNQSAAEELIEIFQNYLDKFAAILIDGHADLRNRDTRNFIILFISDPNIRKNLKRARYNRVSRSSAYDVVSLLQKTCSAYEPDDISQELILILLSLANRYAKKGKKHNFCGYLYNVFRYDLYRRVLAMTRDPAVFSLLDNIPYNDINYVNMDSDFTDQDELYIDVPFIDEEGDSLDHNWVHGYTCNDAFDVLSKLERYILKLSYEDEMTDIDIGKKLSMHRHTIRTKKAYAIQKVRDHAQQNHQLSRLQDTTTVQDKATEAMQ